MQGRIHKMKKWYSKIDRSTGDIVKRKELNNPERALDKPFVWIPEERDIEPEYDKETHKLVQTEVIPDLSDTTVDVSPDAKRALGFDVVALTEEEKAQINTRKIADSDGVLARMTEDILVIIAQGGVLEKDSFADEVWEKINTRRVLRGEDEV
jgi:hypothetical protein